jgi:hypothetical protein
MATLFAIASYAGSLVVLATICFGLGKYNARFGMGGSFVVMAAMFMVFSPFAALGFHLARRGFVHATRGVVAAGMGAGIVAPLLVFLLDWAFSQQLVTYLLPILTIFVAGYASARLTEKHPAATAG